MEKTSKPSKTKKADKKLLKVKTEIKGGLAAAYKSTTSGCITRTA